MTSYLPLSDLRRTFLHSLNEMQKIDWASNQLLAWGRGSGYVHQLANGRHVITPLGRLAFRTDTEHMPTLRARHIGESPIAGGGPIYGSGLSCRCGWKTQNNERPASKGGNTVLKREHREHVQAAFDTAREAAA